uniref:Uncharacterized protein n=1 Tax=Molossus molossus TaxID=27622 RepID=A0A7J8GLM0_MOLMO|nr:hypothetical protein HJG59_013901 [Molossus molossus]
MLPLPCWPHSCEPGPVQGHTDEKSPMQDGPLGPRGLAEATEMCTQECLVLGHSDNCWMPPGLGPYQHPKSPLSTFAPQKEWVKKDKLVNGHTLTRAWKEDGNRNQFNDPIRPLLGIQYDSRNTMNEHRKPPEKEINPEKNSVGTNVGWFLWVGSPATAYLGALLARIQRR